MNKGVLATVLSAALVAGGEAGDTQSLVKQLGSSHYPTREKATQALKAQYGPKIESELLQACPSDLEAKRRIAMLLGPFREKQIIARMQKIKDRYQNVLPWIELKAEDCVDHWSVQSFYYNQVPHGTANRPPDWEAYSKATEILLLEMSKQGIDPAPMAEKLKQRHLQWIEQFGKNYHPPIVSPWKSKE